MISNKNILNKAIPDNIEKFVSFLQIKGIKYDDFKKAGPTKKQNLLIEFLKLHPEVLQYRIF